MSDRVNKFCSDLQSKLNDMEGRLNSLKTSLKVAPKQAEDALHRQLSQSQQKLDSQKQAVDKAAASLRTWADQKKAEVKATVDQWKHDHEVKKLANRADRSEEYAAAAILIAASRIDEAEHAILEAIVARVDADAVPA